MKVITYRLAHLPAETDLCPVCVARGDHLQGALGPVQHGLHEGTCEGARHDDRRLSRDYNEGTLYRYYIERKDGPHGARFSSKEAAEAHSRCMHPGRTPHILTGLTSDLRSIEE